jgi:hypothetical protein
LRALILLVFSLSALSCHSLGFNENKESYYHWRVKRTYDQIFDGTEVKPLKGYLYSDDGQGLIASIRSEGIDLETGGYEGINLLNWAVGAQRYNCVETLLEAGADPDYLNKLEIGNLSLAVFFADEKLIRQIASKVETMDKSPKRYTLRDAISDHGTLLLPLLVELGANPDLSTTGGNPLRHSIGIADIESALLLLDLGANPITTPKEMELFTADFKRNPFGYAKDEYSFRYKTDDYGELYQRMIGFGVAEPNEAHNEWLIKQGREPNSLTN